jgi:hypothetical protein
MLTPAVGALPRTSVVPVGVSMAPGAPGFRGTEMPRPGTRERFHIATVTVLTSV